MIFFSFLFSVCVCLHTKQQATAGELLPHKRALTGQSLQSSQWHHHCETLTWVISVSQRWNGDEKRILHLGEKRRVGRDREHQRRQKQWGKKGIDGRLTKGWYGSRCVCVCCAVLCWAGLCSAVHGAALTAEPKRSLIWHVWCGPAPTIQPFVVPPHWAAWQWSAKQQWQRGPTIRMANLLMHPRADSLTFLFTTQSGCEGGRDERRERGGKKKKKETKCCFSFNHPVVSCPHSCCSLQDATLQACWCCLRQLSRIGGTVVDTDKNEAER